MLALLGAAAIAAALTKTTTSTHASGPLLAGLLLFPTLGLAAAPCNSWAARRTSPPPLRQRERTQGHRARRAFAVSAAAGGLVTVLCTIIAAGVVLSAPNHLLHPSHPAGSAASSTPSLSRLDKCPILKEGYRGGCVSLLQAELNADDRANLPVDGTFGPATGEAVRAFQREHGIVPADGIAGPGPRRSSITASHESDPCPPD